MIGIILLYFGLGVLLGLAFIALGIKQSRRWLTALGAAILVSLAGGFVIGLMGFGLGIPVFIVAILWPR